MISIDEATPYLLGRGLIDRSWVIDGALSIHVASRRNRNLRVEGPDGAGYFLKQPDGPAADGHRTLRAEAAFYRFCQGEPALEPMTRIAPRLIHYDDERPLLALSLLPDAGPLGTLDERRGPEAPAPGAIRAFGAALGSVHRLFGGPPESRPACPPEVRPDLPGVLTFHRPGPESLVRLGTANRKAIRILQGQPGLAERLDALADSWRIESLIHGDIRLDNVLAWESGDPPGWQVRIVDWEMVRLGDPAWDLAGALQDLVGLWIRSFPFEPGLTFEEQVDRAACPLEAVQQVIRSLWEGYRAAVDRRPSDLDHLLDRAVRFSAARMIQTAYELSYYAAKELHPVSVILLQAAVNILSRPDVARVQLYGLLPPFQLP